MRRAIIVGASSGLGRELAKIMSRDGWPLGLAGRNTEALEGLKAELAGEVHIAALDVTQTAAVSAALDTLKQSLGDVDVLVISSGVSPYNRKLEWDLEQRTIATNVDGFAACANWGAHHFFGRKGGQLVGLSSVASLRGSGSVPAYNASKAFASHYMEGLRFNLARYGVTVTDVRPGYVETPMSAGQKGMFWVVGAATAARQIYGAILRKRAVAYVPRRWAIMALLIQVVPRSIYKRFGN
jgi:short-subunit dehydrogenase